MEKIAKLLDRSDLYFGLKRGDLISGKNKLDDSKPNYNEATIYQVGKPWNGACIVLHVNKSFHTEGFRPPVTLYYDEVHGYRWYQWIEKEE